MMRTAVIALALLISATIGLYANGNILLWGGEYPQACIGWNDDSVYSWWCTPDYTVRRLLETEYELWAWQQSAARLESELYDCNQA